MAKITLEQKEIETTAEHPFYTQAGWKDAADLRSNDRLRSREGKWQRIKEVSFAYEQKKVYNFEVAGWHTYFVGAWQWLVHNATVCFADLAKAGVKYAKNILNGQLFDKAMRQAYEYVQIKMTNGKVLDALVPGKEIISHKYTQLSEITTQTAKSYINEIGSKYENVMTASTKLEDQIMTTGQKILEVPPQLKDIPDEVLKYAKRNKVKIREVSGEALKAFNRAKFW